MMDFKEIVHFLGVAGSVASLLPLIILSLLNFLIRFFFVIV